jgi:polysaccharide deacetylase 2 family uncharacterized protein YibQ
MTGRRFWHVDVKVLAYGYLVMGVLVAAVVAWLALAGPAATPSVADSITVPIEIITPPPESELASQDALPAPPQPPANGTASAKPFDTADKRPRIGIIITELGPSATAVETAIMHLPPEISFAFLPFSNDTDALAGKSRVAGHEILLDIPMEPATFPEDDPGPDALMTTVSDTENIRRFNWDLARASGYVGIVNFMGSRFTASEEKLQPIFTTLHAQGLLVVDTRANPLTAVPTLAAEMKVPFAVADLTIDSSASRDAIDANLARLEQIATQKGRALGIAGTYPITFERLAQWSKSLSAKGIALAPVSAIVTTPK